MWRKLKVIKGGKSKKSKIPTIKTPNKAETDQEKADELAKYFLYSECRRQS